MAETTKKAKAPAKAKKTAVKKIEAVESAKTNGHAPAAEVSVSKEAVAQLAHRFWAERGHQHGNHVDDWFRAEQQLRSKAS